MQAVVLAGGRGERLGCLTNGQPKPLVDVCGQPFLAYQLRLLRDSGITGVLLCVGHLADQIIDFCGDGRRFGLHVEYSVEEGSLLGTAGAVKLAEPLLGDVFLLTYADAYLRMDYAAAYRYLERRPEPALMTVYRNEGRYDASNVAVADGYVRVYDKAPCAPGLDYINFGVSVLRKDALAYVPEGVFCSQEEWYQDLIRRRQLLAFETHQRFYEVGSPAGLREFRDLVARGELP
jgi:NDP-sugar pyrophosphorylase family protein